MHEKFSPFETMTNTCTAQGKINRAKSSEGAVKMPTLTGAVEKCIP